MTVRKHLPAFLAFNEYTVCHNCQETEGEFIFSEPNHHYSEPKGHFLFFSLISVLEMLYMPSYFNKKVCPSEIIF